jgi:glycerol-3-phosphate dehydrogenase
VGPWSKILLEQNNIKSQKDIDYIKGSHLIINRKSEFGLMFSGVCKSRYIFALPYQDYTLLGTTEEKVSHPELPEISKNEIKYLIDSFNYILKKSISKKEIISSYSGVRPLIKSKDNFHKSSRDFFIQKNDSLLTIFGGKWTTSPSIARKIVTMI